MSWTKPTQITSCHLSWSSAEHQLELKATCQDEPRKATYIKNFIFSGNFHSKAQKQIYEHSTADAVTRNTGRQPWHNGFTPKSMHFEVCHLLCF